MHRCRFLVIIFCLFLLSSCSSTPSIDLPPATPQLVFLHTDPSGFLQLASQPDIDTSPSILSFSFPSNCSIYNLYPNPVDSLLAIELLCGEEPLVEVVDLQTGADSSRPAYQETVRFLAWSMDGQSFYIKKNAFDNPQVLKVDLLSNRTGTISLPAGVYDLVSKPDGYIIYSLTLGLGFGSETWLADSNGHNVRQLLVEPQKIVAYLRPSPDGSQVAFILMPDSETPFPPGELWVMNADGTNPHFLAGADAGHGYTPAWSPDGTHIAFVVRENPGDSNADQSDGALLSNVYLIDVQSGILTPISSFTDAIVESPVWTPDGTSLFFNVVRNDTIRIWVSNNGSPRQFSEELACCAFWVPGR
jgi:WD40 repeat protein